MILFSAAIMRLIAKVHGKEREQVVIKYRLLVYAGNDAQLVPDQDSNKRSCSCVMRNKTKPGVVVVLPSLDALAQIMLHGIEQIISILPPRFLRNLTPGATLLFFTLAADFCCFFIRLHT